MKIDTMKILKKLAAVWLAVCLVCSFSLTGALAASEYRLTAAASTEYAEIGDTVKVDLLVSSGSHETFNAFYTVFRYDSSMFTFDEAGLVDRGFEVTVSGEGLLNIVKVGGNVPVGEDAVLSLPFTAKASGNGTFSVVSSKIDAAEHAFENAPAAATGSGVTVSVGGDAYAAAITVNRTWVEPNGAFLSWLVLTGTPGAKVPAAARLRMNYYSSTCMEAEPNPALADPEISYRGAQCSISYSGLDGVFDDEGQFWLAQYTFSAGTNDVLLEMKEATVTDDRGTRGIPFEKGNSRVTVEVKEAGGGESGPVDTTGLDLESTVWDGVTVDVSWYFGHEEDPRFTISTAAQLAGAAALVNGLVNENCRVYTGKDVFTASEWNHGSYVFSAIGSSGSNNKSTNEYHYGITRLEGATLALEADLDMSAGNYMPVGGQYLMTKNDNRTKISSSFCGLFDGQGHQVTILCDRHCSTGNYGDGQSVGLIGLLGVHDNEAANAPGGMGVRDVEVHGSVSGNRSVGGVVGKVGKSADATLIQRCANFASITGSDSKGVGGVVGSAWNRCEVRDCYNRGSVTNTGGFAAGGIAGTAEGPVANCYNTGVVTSGSDSYAMAIGTNNGGASFTNCWYLDGCAAGGGFYNGTRADNSGAMSSEAMQTEAFVSTLGSAFSMDTKAINDGYPILTWQEGRGELLNVDKTALEAAIAAARSDRESVTVSADGSDVEQTEQWVSEEEASGFEMAIAVAQKVVDDPLATRDDVSEALTDLALAQMTFDAAKKNGTKSTAPSSDSTGANPVKYPVTVRPEDNGSVSSSVSSARAGQKVTVTATPAEGYEVDQVSIRDKDGRELAFTDNGDGTYTYQQPASRVTVDITYKEKTAEPEPVRPGSDDHEAVCPSKAFRDLDTSLWYHEAIDYVLSHDYFNGVGGGLFEPDGTMTRAMFVTVLGRVNGVNVSQYQNTPFADVPAGQWYTAYVAWASEHGIVLGYDSETFGPDDSITREQMAAILYRYAKYAGEDVTAVDATRFHTFVDADTVSDYAKAPMIWAVDKGLINGMGDGTLAPQKTATRAEVAQLMMNFDQIVR